MQKHMVENSLFLEKIANAETVKELLFLEKEILETIVNDSGLQLVYAMVLIAGENDVDGFLRKDLLEMVTPYNNFFISINKKLFKLIPDANSLAKALEKISDEGMRKRLIMRFDYLNVSF
jgi:hypothetical protein